MDRFSAYLLLKSHLRRPASRRRARRVEAIVEAFAARVPGADPERWAALALLSSLDLEYAEHNPDVCGSRAAEMAALEGVDPEGCAVLACWRDDASRPLPAVEDRALVEALRSADAIVVAIDLCLAEEGEDPHIDEALRPVIEDALSLLVAKRVRGMENGLDDPSALGPLGDDVRALAEVALGGLVRLEEARP